MPQFDLFTFSSQIFWALFFFTLLYLSLAYYLIPSISATLKVRNRRLKLQNGSSQTSSVILASENNISLDLCITKLDLGFYTANDYNKFIDSLSYDKILGDSLISFKLSQILNNLKSLTFLEACLFH